MKTFYLCVLLAAVLLQAACQGAKTGSPAPSLPPQTTPPAVTPNTTSPPEAVPPAVPPVNPVPPPVVSQPPQNNAQGPYDVWIQGFSFNPARLIVPVGTTVTWTNKDGDAHDVTSDPRGLFGQQLTGSGGTSSYTFTTAGTYNYVCSIHAGMSGTVIAR